jgi:hypothetical protein
MNLARLTACDIVTTVPESDSNGKSTMLTKAIRPHTP